MLRHPRDVRAADARALGVRASEMGARRCAGATHGAALGHERDHERRRRGRHGRALFGDLLRREGERGAQHEHARGARCAQRLPGGGEGGGRWLAQGRGQGARRGRARSGLRRAPRAALREHPVGLARSRSGHGHRARDRSNHRFVKVGANQCVTNKKYNATRRHVAPSLRIHVVVRVPQLVVRVVDRLHGAPDPRELVPLRPAVDPALRHLAVDLRVQLVLRLLGQEVHCRQAGLLVVEGVVLDLGQRALRVGHVHVVALLVLFPATIALAVVHLAVVVDAADAPRRFVAGHAGADQRVAQEGALVHRLLQADGERLAHEAHAAQALELQPLARPPVARRVVGEGDRERDGDDLAEDVVRQHARHRHDRLLGPLRGRHRDVGGRWPLRILTVYVKDLLTIF